jgi:hypothetical protein
LCCRHAARTNHKAANVGVRGRFGVFCFDTQAIIPLVGELGLA